MVGKRKALTGAGVALLAAASLAVASGSAAAAGPFFYTQAANASATPTIVQFDASGSELAALSPASVSGAPLASGSVPAVAPDGRSLYVAADGAVYQYDIAADGTLSPKEEPSVLAGAQAISIAINPDGRSAYVADSGDDTISQYDIGADGGLTQKAPATVATGNRPASIAVGPNGRTAYVANSGDDTISVYDVGEDGRLTPRPDATVTLDAGPQSIAIAPDGKSLYAVSGGSVLYAFDVAADGTLTPKPQPTTSLALRDDQGTLTGTSEAEGIAISPDGRDLYVGDGEGLGFRMAHVSLDGDGTATLADLAPLPTGSAQASNAQTSGPVVSPDGRSVYTFDTNTGTILGYDRASDGSLSLKSPAFASLPSAAGLSEGVAITPSSDLSVQTAAAPGPVGVGQSLTYTLDVTDDGTPATNVTLDQPVGSDVVLLSATSSQGSCTASGAVHCSLGSLLDGATATVTVTLQPLDAGTVTLTPAVSATQPDPDVTDNSFDATATVLAAPLATTGAASDLTPTSATLNGVILPNGQSTNYHFEYGVGDALDLHAPASDANAGNGTSGVAVSAPVTGLLPATRYSYRLVADNSAGDAVNGATETFTTPVLPVPDVDLGLAGSAAPASANVGGLVTFSYTVRNASATDAAHDVRIVDPLPGGVSFSTGDSTPGCTAAADGTTVTCAVGTLPPGASATVAIAVHAGQAGALTNTAVVSADEPDPSAADDVAVTRATVAAPVGSDQGDGGTQTGQTGPSGQTGPGTKPAPAKVTLSGKSALRSGAVRTTLACTGATCSGTITLTTSVRTVVRTHGKKVTRTRTVALGSARYKLAAGKKATVAVKLSRSGSALLARAHKLTATLALQLGTNAKARPVAQRKLLLRAQGKPRR